MSVSMTALSALHAALHFYICDCMLNIIPCSSWDMYSYNWTVKYYAKQKHLGCKKVRGQSEATLQKKKGGQVTKPIILV